MLDIFNNMDLSVITAKPAGWAEDRICVAISAEVVENLFNLQTCLKVSFTGAIRLRFFCCATGEATASSTRSSNCNGVPQGHSSQY